MIENFEKHVHPNHFLIFCLKEMIIFNKLDQADIAEVIEENVHIAQEILDLVSKIDPGFTPRRGKLLKFLSKERLKLMRLMESKGKAKSSYEMIQQANSEHQEADLCLS